MPNQVPPYASPETGAKVRRSRHLADALAAMQNQDPAVYNTALGTNLSVLSKALGSFTSAGADKDADEALQADRKTLSDKLMGGYKSAGELATDALDGDQAFDLTPAGSDRRVGRAKADQFDAISQYLDPMAAMQFKMQQDATAKADERYEAEQRRPIAGDKPLVNPLTFAPVYTPPVEPAEVKAPKYVAQDFNNKVWMVNENEPTDRYELGTPNVKGGDGDGSKFSDENTLRGQYLGQTSSFKAIRDSYAKMTSVMADYKQRPDVVSPANDISLIFNFMRMQDPTATVMANDYATAENAAGVDVRVRDIYNKVMDGGKLAPEQRQDFFQNASTIYNAQEASYEQTRKFYTDAALGRGMDPGVIPDFRLPKIEDEPEDAGPSQQEFGRFIAMMPPSIAKFMSAAPAQGSPAAAPAALPPRDLNAVPEGWTPALWATLDAKERQEVWEGRD